MEFYHGKATITIHFKNRVMWQKYRQYVLKTGWDFDGCYHPYTATLEMEFSSLDDIINISKQVAFLLSLKFDVESCNWKLDRSEEEDELQEYDPLNFEDLWKISSEENMEMFGK